MPQTNSSEITLNKEQQQAATYKGGPLLIIAGAGTGKTTVVTERIKHLIVTELALPSEILALTFTEKAAREMEERVDIAVPYGYTQMWISTFHAFCDRILRAEALAIGLPTNYRLLTEAEATQLLRSNLFSFDLSYFRPLGNPTKFIGGMLQHFSRLQDEDVTPEQYLKFAREIRNSKFEIRKEREEIEKFLELARAYQKYRELKVKEGVMDFGDLITNALLLFRRRPAILKRYQQQFKYILVDEFQDTNYAQNELAILLAGKRANITAVADDDQSIYRFRGAAVSNVMQFRKHFPKTKIVTLTQNYRSTQEILDKAYELIQHNNPDRLEVKEKIDKKLVSVRKIRGEHTEFLYTDRVENEADRVAKTILSLVQKEDRSFSDFAILVRANNHAEALTRAFSRAGIPFQFLGPGQLFRQEEIKDLTSYLKVLYNFEDSLSLYRVLSMDHFDIPARDLAGVMNYARRFNLSLFEACEDVNKIFVRKETKEMIDKFIAMVTRHLKAARRETAGQLLFYFLQDSGLLTKLAKPENQLEERRAQNITRFFDKLKTYETEYEDASVTAVVDWIGLSMELGESPQAADIDWDRLNAVYILTVHSSKGLEFPIVFLVNLVAGRFPTYERREQIPIPDELIKEELPIGDYHIEEERRLFYVGMTRARDRLYLSAANYYGEGKRERKISPFVMEALGEEAIQPSTINNQQQVSQLTLLEWSKQEIPEQPTTHTSLPPITYLSYSQIQEFKVCPLHYKLKYIVRVPVPPSAAQSFGITLHKTMADFYNLVRARRKGTLDELMKLYEENWIREGYSSKQYESLMKKRGEGYLENYYKNEFDSHHVPILMEHPFVFRIENLKVGGKIDRVDKTKNGIEIIDYKTGANLPTDKELAQDLQLTVYALAGTEIKEEPFGRKPEDLTLSLYFFEGGQKLTTTRTQEQLNAAKKEIVKVAHEIATSDFQCSGSILCQSCEYRMFCGGYKP
ncbi:UvrD-helicase domain-containing protein [Candidatus Microgenomates bacterium]|nr:UvrD-helicase domain-containing protein [Candidatus Microgenomates bacterium]